MRDITIARRLRERKADIDPGEYNQPPAGHTRVLCMAFQCQTCKLVVERDIIAKQAYSENDVISVVKAALNFAHYQCGCDE